MLDGILQEKCHMKRSISKKDIEKLFPLLHYKKSPKAFISMWTMKRKKISDTLSVASFRSFGLQQVKGRKILAHYSCFHSFLLSNSIFIQFWYIKRRIWWKRREKIFDWRPRSSTFVSHSFSSSCKLKPQHIDYLCFRK